MRLTDLLRDNDGKKKPAASIFSKIEESFAQEKDTKPFPKKNGKEAVHLQADDLAALYNIDIPEDETSAESSARRLCQTNESRRIVIQRGILCRARVSAAVFSAGQLP